MLGLLCSAGLGTMTEILAWDGPWSLEMIEAMVPEAQAIQVARERAQFQASAAAVASAFSKTAGKQYNESLDKVLAAVRAAQEDGGQDKQAAAADALIEQLKQIPGLRRV